jgi:hypothetical protein
MFHTLFWFFPDEKSHESVVCAVLRCERTTSDGNEKRSPPNWQDSKTKSGSGAPPKTSHHPPLRGQSSETAHNDPIGYQKQMLTYGS